jgi:hypothetical protein
MPVHHLLEQILNDYIEAAGLQSGQPLFQSVNSAGTALSRTAISPSDVAASHPGRTSIRRPLPSTTSKAELDRPILLDSLPATFAATNRRPPDLLCFPLVNAPSFELALQGAHCQTALPAKLAPPQSTCFISKHQSLDLITASSLSPRNFLAFSH